ncbi:hypothetical protein RhiirA1_437101 [Rhizophagus irregularis]|uniref:Uncharacterized protein n=1 Tax=Rhizophagus irregularis TaxID=588596 RepID=A0A2N0SF42_9GLOM|nr:hypothetical protein RhiirA1_437101 [Rhizophagus irregularis]
MVILLLKHEPLMTIYKFLSTGFLFDPPSLHLFLSVCEWYGCVIFNKNGSLRLIGSLRNAFRPGLSPAVQPGLSPGKYLVLWCLWSFRSGLSPGKYLVLWCLWSFRSGLSPGKYLVLWNRLMVF